MITGLGMNLGRLLSGTIIVEEVFSWPGFGRYFIEAIFNRDIPVIQSYVLIAAGLFIVCNLIVDLLQMYYGSSDFMERNNQPMISRIRTGLRNQKTAVVCSVILVLFFIVTLLAPWLSPHDPIQVNLAIKLQSSSWEHLLGTDHLGRDNLSRLLHGSRISLGFAFLIFISSMLIGLLVGRSQAITEVGSMPY